MWENQFDCSIVLALRKCAYESEVRETDARESRWTWTSWNLNRWIRKAMTRGKLRRRHSWKYRGYANISAVNTWNHKQVQRTPKLYRNGSRKRIKQCRSWSWWRNHRKLARALFPRLTRNTTELMKTRLNGRARYFAVLIDDCYRWYTVRFLKQKSDVFQAFAEYKDYAETRTVKKMKCLQTDNGKEYCNSRFDEFLRRIDILRRLIVHYTPKQNGVAERRNRTGRCFLLQSGLPASFWARL